MEKPSWEQYMFDIASVVKSKSTCPSRQVGAVIFDPETHFILATGYNGAPRGMPHCTDECLTREKGKDWEKCKSIHAEMNAIFSAAKAGIRIDGAHMAITVTPCLFCARGIIQTGIKKIYCMSEYEDTSAYELLKKAGVAMKIHNGIAFPDFWKGNNGENF